MQLLVKLVDGDYFLKHFGKTNLHEGLPMILTFLDLGLVEKCIAGLMQNINQDYGFPDALACVAIFGSIIQSWLILCCSLAKIIFLWPIINEMSRLVSGLIVFF